MVRNTARTRPDPRTLLRWFFLLLFGAALLGARPGQAQELDPAELEELVAPVALYPDDVLGIILPASTFPLDIVRAARFLDEREVDPSLEPDPEWDDSVVALLNYPEVLRMMDENIDWTWDLGEAVLTDQAAVLAAAQDFRSRALAAGNLQSDGRQTVTSENGAITIVPADPEVIYIPVYEPREVVVYHSTPIWRYYPVAYPVYYYPYPYGYAFNVGFFWGVTSYFSIGWHSHYVHVHHHTHYAHPYYLNSYYSYAPYYPRSHVNVTVVVNNYDNVWVPSPRRGGRPEMATVEGRASAARTMRTSTVEGQRGAAPRASTSRMTAAESPSSRSVTGASSQSRSSSGNAASARSPATGDSSGNVNNGVRTMRAPETADLGQGAAERPSTRQSATTSGSTSPTRMNAPSATRATPQTSTRTAPQASTRTAPQTSTRTAPPASTRTAPQASTRTAPPSSATRMAPQTSTRTAPSSGGSTRSGSGASQGRRSQR